MNVVRTLVVAEEAPWPLDTGFRQRLHHVVRGLGDAGPVALALVEAERSPPPALPADLVHRCHQVTAPWRRRSDGALRWAVSRSPRWVAGRQWRDARDLVHQISGDYDVLWFEHVHLWSALHPTSGPAVVVDIDNLMSVVVARQAAVESAIRAVMLRADRPRWRQLERRAARTAAAAVVCSDEDARLLGSLPVVVPNGYVLPGSMHRQPRRGPAILLFVASFDYPPNADAAAWFAAEVLPRVRSRRPDVRLRLVGRTGGAFDVSRLAAVPGVEVVGRVDDLLPELQSATISIAPLRVGGGTRIKVLEAFAAGVPVVATSVGCDGLGVEPGRHLLVADDAGGLADACLRLLGDAALGDRLVTAGRQLWQDGYRWEVIRPRVTELVRRVAAR